MMGQINWWSDEDLEFVVVEAEDITPGDALRVAKEEAWRCEDPNSICPIRTGLQECCSPQVTGPKEIEVWDGEIGDPSLEPRKVNCYQVTCH